MSFHGIEPSVAIALLRALQGLTQREVARRAGLSPATVCRVESGGGRVSAEARQRVARALLVEPQLLFPSVEGGGQELED